MSVYRRRMDDSAAHEALSEVLSTIDAWGSLYNARRGKKPPYQENDGLASRVDAGLDEVRTRARLARDIVIAMGEPELAERVVEHEEGAYGPHPFMQAHVAIVEAIAILSQREELEAIVGPAGPRLSASDLNAVIWGSAAALWDGGHIRAAVQTAATALEGLLQDVAGPAVSGETLATVFSLTEPTASSARLRLPGLDPESKTWMCAHEGAAALIRAAFLGVRNLVSRPGYPDPTEQEGLEMLAVLSYAARLVERSERVALDPQLVIVRQDRTVAMAGSSVTPQSPKGFSRRPVSLNARAVPNDPRRPAHALSRLLLLAGLLCLREV